MKCFLGISNFLEEISSTSKSIVFLYFFALITEEGFLISPCSSLELCIQVGISFFFFLCFMLLFFSQLFVRPTQTAILFFCISFSWGWSWFLFPVQCHELPSIVHQALYQILSLKAISHFHCIVITSAVKYSFHEKLDILPAILVLRHPSSRVHTTLNQNIWLKCVVPSKCEHLSCLFYLNSPWVSHSVDQC